MNFNDLKAKALNKKQMRAIKVVLVLVATNLQVVE